MTLIRVQGSHLEDRELTRSLDVLTLAGGHGAAPLASVQAGSHAVADHLPALAAVVGGGVAHLQTGGDHRQHLWRSLRLLTDDLCR